MTAGLFRVQAGGTLKRVGTVPAAPGDTTAPTVPGALQATSTGQTSVTLSWTASTDAVGVTGYEVSTAAAGVIAAPSASPYTVTGLTASTTYTFRVRARDAAGNFSAYASLTTTTSSAGTGTITHGSQLTTANTGFVAYNDTSLGRNLTLSDLTAGGPTSSSSAGQIIYKRIIAGGFDFNHANVTLRGCWIQGEVHCDASNPTIEYCRIGPATVGQNGNGVRGIGLAWGGYTATRVELYGFSDGMRANDVNTLIQECYIHDLFSAPGDHNDCVQVTGALTNTRILRSKLWNDYGQSACLQCGSEQGVSDGIILQDCYVKAPNGAYGWAMGNTGDSGTHHVQILNNIFEGPSAQADLGERPFEYVINGNTLLNGTAIPNSRVGM